jgi:hypothetical protein
LPPEHYQQFPALAVKEVPSEENPAAQLPAELIHVAPYLP